MAEETLDARRLLCPLPVMRTQDRVAQLEQGDVLEVVCTDPGVLHDIPVWCRVHGHSVISTRTEGREYFVTLRVEA
ncbi:MAG: SirA family protein [Gammaproteobacteria bacterium]|nr:SirA family protein [Gammaproteobacteria bacterium]